MTANSFEEAGRFGQEFMDTGLKSFAALSKGMQSIAAETGDYSRKTYEQGSAALEKLVSAKSLEKAVEIQADYARQAYGSFVAQAARIGELYADVARDACKPFESAAAGTK